jgi:hypothetical protein
MKRIKDFSKVIGIIGRGGSFFPSNPPSEVKWQAVFEAVGVKAQSLLNREGLRWFRDRAKEQGFKILVIERGLNR